MENHEEQPLPKEDVVVDIAKTRLSDLWKLEDYWAIWLGFIILLIGLLVFLPNPPQGMEEDILKYNSIMKDESEKAPFKTTAWHQASKAKSKIRGTNQGYAKKNKKVSEQTKIMEIESFGLLLSGQS